MALVDKFENGKGMTLQEHLAIERTKLANERTLFSYIRASLFLLTVGIGIFEINSIWHLRWLGWVCLGASVVILSIGGYRFLLMKKHLKSFVKNGVNPKTE